MFLVDYLIPLGGNKVRSMEESKEKGIIIEVEHNELDPLGW
jgi:hypothetical protein